jgi:FkbM family methyltransferase
VTMWRFLRYPFLIASAALPPIIKARICLRLAEQLGMTKLYANGEYGEILGYSSDRVVFAEYLVNGIYMPWLARAFKDVFDSRGGGTYLDIGANIGLTTIPIARDKNVACYAFEPEPGNFFALTQNVRKNCPSENVRLFDLALFDRAGELEFELAESGNPGDHRVRIGGANGALEAKRESRRDVIKVRSVCLDDLLATEQLRKPICAKIDIQGAEANLYRGGRRILSACEVLITEFWPYGLKRLGEDPDALLSLFAEDFPICRVRVGGIMHDRAELTGATRISESLPQLMKLAQQVGSVDLELRKA